MPFMVLTSDLRRWKAFIILQCEVGIILQRIIQSGPYMHKLLLGKRFMTVGMPVIARKQNLCLGTSSMWQGIWSMQLVADYLVCFRLRGTFSLWPLLDNAYQVGTCLSKKWLLFWECPITRYTRPESKLVELSLPSFANSKLWFFVPIQIYLWFLYWTPWFKDTVEQDFLYLFSKSKNGWSHFHLQGKRIP